MAVKGYSLSQIRLHWVIAALILFQLIFGEDMGGAWDTFEEGGVPVMTNWVWAHIIVGIAVLVLVLWRVMLRVSRGVPDAPHNDSALMMRAAEWGHLALYAVMFVVPMTGLVAWYGGVGEVAEIHGWAKPIVIVLVAGHVVASLYHHFWLKDGLLLRMKRPLD